MSTLGQQYGGNRDVYEALGYPLEPNYTDYSTRYTRQDIAKAIIDRPVDATWRGGFEVYEADDDRETEFEKAWAELSDRLGLRSVFRRLDKLTGLGKYGVLLLGYDDVSSTQSLAQEVSPTSRRLVYVRPLGEGSAEIAEWETDVRSERYGMPLYYSIKVSRPGGYTSDAIRVHYSRVLHIVDGMMESETEGTPRLEGVFNRLFDLEKLVGASAEMFWRGARPGYKGKIDADAQLTPEDEADLEDQFEEYEHNLRRFLIATGLDIEALAPQVADPSQHVDIQIQMISAVTGIPKRILVGSERGELASTQDITSWREIVVSRREEFAEPLIIRPFIEAMVERGVLPESDSWFVKWADLWAPSEKERVDVGKVRAESVKLWGESPAQDLLPPEVMYEHVLGFSREQTELLLEQRERAIQEEEVALAQAQEEEAQLRQEEGEEGQPQEGEE
jgi:hypothetical protein